jgi:hypothetical protein
LAGLVSGTSSSTDSLWTIGGGNSDFVSLEIATLTEELWLEFEVKLLVSALGVGAGSVGTSSMRIISSVVTADVEPPKTFEKFTL